MVEESLCVPIISRLYVGLATVKTKHYDYCTNSGFTSSTQPVVTSDLLCNQSIN